MNINKKEGPKESSLSGYKDYCFQKDNIHFYMILGFWACSNKLFTWAFYQYLNRNQE